jgi:uncharacterized protein YecE (DUF72 family)
LDTRYTLSSNPKTQIPDPPELRSPLRIGTAGWSIPLRCSDAFQSEGSHLERYSRVFTCAEINSSFYRSHRPDTYARWTASTPEHFRFSVKVPKTITHEAALTPSRELMQTFLAEAGQLEQKLGPLLFQLPPRQGFTEPHARAFLDLFRNLYPAGQAALEPRHATWFSEEASELLREYYVARVIADPPRAPGAFRPGGDPGLIYYRLHGSPRMYYSSYEPAWIEEVAASIEAQLTAPARQSKRQSSSTPSPEVWCIFDNTASGAATENALTLSAVLDSRRTA